MILRDWTDPRDGRNWTIWIAKGARPLLVFASDGELQTVLVSFKDGIEDVSDPVLQRWLDEARRCRTRAAGG